jgi:carbon monoxide dehydrogenase subunit G
LKQGTYQHSKKIHISIEKFFKWTPSETTIEEADRMPEGEVVFPVNAPILRTWDLLSNMEKVAACTPNVESVQVLSETKSEWTLKVKMGPISRKIKLLNETLSSNPPTHAEFKGEGENVTMRGSIDLREVSSDATEVKYKVFAKGSGALAAILDNVIKSQMQSNMDEFRKRVKEKLESV